MRRSAFLDMGLLRGRSRTWRYQFKMSIAKPKKNGPAKCRKSGAPIEGQDWVKIGGARWLREVAVKEGKFIPIEYREGYQPKQKPVEAAPEASAEEVPVAETTEAAAE